MKNIKVLDVTLRDGGCVNDFNFGQTYMEKILAALEQSGIDIIEVGYIDKEKGSKTGRTKYINEQVIAKGLLGNKMPYITYVAMMDYGRYDPDDLLPYDGKGIDGIRLAFHRKNYKDIASLGKKILDKGYKLYIQPMITFKYSDYELLDLIDIVNTQLSDASAFYIVDSFGEMRPDDMDRVLYLVDHNLNRDMTIGLHSHNNLQMSYSNACAMMEFKTNREIIIDCSIMGMGKGAGNLNTELLIEHLNRFYGKNYKIDSLLDVIDKVVNQLYDEYKWGYSVEYYLSSINGCTPSYAGHFYNKHMLNVDQVNSLLARIPEEKKISFDKEFAENLYRQYNDENPVDDSMVLDELTKDLRGKRVLIIAPGRSVTYNLNRIKELIDDPDFKSIALNPTLDLLYDYVLTTRADIYKNYEKRQANVIVPSNVIRNKRENKNARVLNYNTWIDKKDGVHDSSAIIAFNLLKSCGVKEISLAGFDGFSVNINENYYDPNMRHPVTVAQQTARNKYYKDYIANLKKSGIAINFITKSMYEDNV